MPESETNPPDARATVRAAAPDADARDAQREAGFRAGRGPTALVGPALFGIGLLALAWTGSADRTPAGNTADPATGFPAEAGPLTGFSPSGISAAGPISRPERPTAGGFGNRPKKSESGTDPASEAVPAAGTEPSAMARVSTAVGTARDRCVRIRRLAETSCRKQIFPDQDAPMSECVKRELRYTLWSIYGCR